MQSSIYFWGIFSSIFGIFHETNGNQAASLGVPPWYQESFTSNHHIQGDGHQVGPPCSSCCSGFFPAARQCWPRRCCGSPSGTPVRSRWRRHGRALGVGRGSHPMEHCVASYFWSPKKIPGRTRTKSLELSLFVTNCFSRS